ncbi:MAG: response regulator, partial [Bacteroidia bacterium]
KDMAEFLETLLCTTYTVHSARDGVEALAILEQEKIELLISDVMMPRMDGFELVEHVKGHAQLNSLATILLTARSLEADRLHGLRIGVDDYITKPFSPDELRARVANLLGNSRARHTFDEYTHSPQIESHDAALLSKAEQFVIAQLDNSKLKVSDLAEALAVSERQVFRLIKKLTGLSPVHFIREIRLRTARSLLEQKAFSSIAEVAYHCGFENPSYFARLFHERYGVRPSAL